MKSKLLPAASLLILSLLSCNQFQHEPADIATELVTTLDTTAAYGEEPRLPEPEQRIKDTIALKAAPSLQPAPMDWDKKIIKTAEIRVEVSDHKKFSNHLNDMTRQAGGYIAEETQQTLAAQVETSITIKVPVAAFENMVNQLSGSDVKLLERKITSQDVTGEVVDTRSRLEAKKEVRLKYLEFLKAAKNIDEVLKVQKEISGIQENMEAATARVGYLTHQAAYSTIHLSYYQPIKGVAPGSAPDSFASRLYQSFSSGGEWIVNLVIGLVSIWPLLLLAGAGIFIYKSRKLVTAERRNL